MELVKIKEGLRIHQPEIVDATGSREAAVALILRDGLNGAEILFIERARHDGDPWSGQMAFPGGRREAGDPTPLETARRETLEEVGIDLSRSSNIGRIDDLVAPPASPAHGLVVSCHAFEVRESTPIHLNNEVRNTIWIPVAWLSDPASSVSDYRPRDYDGDFQGIRVSSQDKRVIWGLTFRFLRQFFRVATSSPLS